MTDETNKTDHSETIRRARKRVGKYTPGRWYQGTSGYPPNGHISYIAQAGSAWRGSIISGDYSEEVNSAPWLHIPNPADRDLITDAPDLNAALVAVADERDALRARVAELERGAKLADDTETQP